MKDDRVYLIHIVECIEWIETFTNSGKEDFFNTKLIQDAVVRNLEIIGEAAKKVSKETRYAYTEIPWKKMASLRDVLIHDYFGVDLEVVWNVVENELSNLKEQIKTILDK